MIALLSLSVAALFGAGAYMLMRRSLVKLVMGLVLFGHGANLLIFTMARAQRGRPPLVPPGEEAPAAPFTDPLPLALILTAIVIGFGIVSYAIVLIKRVYEDVGADDLSIMTTTDQ
jgi:multicomponent Na+:H+ antiporter subunit C